MTEMLILHEQSASPNRCKVRLTALLLGCCLGLASAGCDQGVAPSNDHDVKSTNRTSAPPAPGPECLADLPSPTDPEKSAQDAASKGDLRIFRYGDNGVTYEMRVAGFESCTGRALGVRGQNPQENYSDALYRADTLELGEIRDKSQPLDCVDCDYPFSPCGERRLAYAARYNRTIFGLGLRGRTYCPRPEPAAGDAEKGPTARSGK
jgi:hypothetical protein